MAGDKWCLRLHPLILIRAYIAYTQFKGSKLLFDLGTLCVLSEIYIDFTKKNWSKSQKDSDILRFCRDFTHENGRNSLSF